MEEMSQTLFDAKNFYHIGNYAASINAVLPEQESGTATPELLAYAYYSYFAMGSLRTIPNQIDEDDQTPLLAFRYLYDYYEYPEKRQDVIEFFTNKLQEDVGKSNIWHVVASIIFAKEGLHDYTLKALHGSEDLECMALTIQCLLKMHRVDLAKTILAKMQEKNDDATLTQLAQAWVSIYSGGDQLQDAFHIYQEFCEKYEPTPLLLNGQAVCHIGQERYEEAETVLKEALTKKHDDLDTLINLVVVSHLNGKEPEVIDHYLEQIRQYHPDSKFIKDLDDKSAEFDRLAEKYEADSKLDFPQFN